MRSPSEILAVLSGVLAVWPARIVACSGGIDSLLLATVAFRLAPGTTWIVHAGSPAVPRDAGDRVRMFSAQEGWRLHVLSAGEFADPRYQANPVDRCFHCKTNLYSTLAALAAKFDVSADADTVVMSGTNLDDLGDFRPGLRAAERYAVRHPFVDAGIGKAGIRALCRHLELPIADLPASPCLASRLYTGTPVTPVRVRAVDEAERFIRRSLGIDVVRCRLRQDDMWVEVNDADRMQITPEILANADAAARSEYAELGSVRLDPAPYRPGRAFAVSS